MKSYGYRTQRPERVPGTVPVLSLTEFQLRIKKIRANFESKIDADRKVVDALGREISELKNKKSEIQAESARILQEAKAKAGAIIQDADSIRHNTLVDVEDIRARAAAFLETAKDVHAKAAIRKVELDQQLRQVTDATAVLNNKIQSLEYLESLRVTNDKLCLAAAEHEERALAAEARAQVIWDKDKATLAEIARKSREVKQAPFYASQKSKSQRR